MVDWGLATSFLYSVAIHSLMKKEEMLAEREFFNTLQELNYARGEGQELLVRKAQGYARLIPQYSQWPVDKKQFWNAEALCWNGRIENEMRNKISEELSFLTGLNLDLGAGSYSYVKNSIAVDFSEEMLVLNEAEYKAVADLERPLVFRSEIFDSVTAVFVVNYVEHVEQLIKEVKRVLKVGGKFAIVFADDISELHKIHYKNSYGKEELTVLLNSGRFRVNSYTKEKLTFIVGEKGIN